ncbi:MAG TPA: hypothetical protein VFQ78_11050 [Candidatus Udaeobacter sp.]|jgi:hypothetical protein|nr:hypothetical protein [Candidatus Udaeobacter sp.]
MIKTVGVILVGLFLSTVASRAATRNAASPSFADVSAAVTAAADGDTVVVPAGTATWSSTLVISKGITIQGAGATSTIIYNGNTTTRGSASESTPIFKLINSSPGVRRITGIGMKTTVIQNGLNNKAGVGVVCNGYNNKSRVDHCRFDDLYCAVWTENSNGLTDHNLYYNCGQVWRHSGIASVQQYAWDHFRNYPGNADYGSTNMMIHEDETVELTGDSGVTDEVEANSWVIRYCDITYREAHGPYAAADSYGGIDCHGDQPAPVGGQYSAIVTLLYENDIRVKNGAGMSFLQFRGGQAIVYNNRVMTELGGSGSARVDVWDENTYYNVHWPAGQQQYEDHIHNSYIWNNTNSVNGGTPVNGGIGIGNGGGTVVIAANHTANPNAHVWTSAPSPAIALPPYPHPLISGAGPTPTPTPTPTATPDDSPTPTPTPDESPTPTATPDGSATPTPTPSPTPTATPAGTPLGTSFNSTQGEIDSPFVVNTDDSISQSVQTNDPSQGGKATYTFTITEPGNYTMLAMVSCPDAGSNSFFIDTDGDPISTMVWQIPVTSGFESRTVSWSGYSTPRFWVFNAGDHQLVIRGREPDTRIKTITLVKQPGAPSDPHVVGN